MPDHRTPDRFDYPTNLASVGGHGARDSALWPPAEHYQLACLDLGEQVPDLGEGFLAGLAGLRRAVETAWRHRLDGDPAGRTAIAEAMRAVGTYLAGDDDRRAAALRAGAVEHGYTEQALAELARLDEDVTVVAGDITTWPGKHRGGFPTAFGCRRDGAAQSLVDAAMARRGDVGPYLRSLHPDLRLGELPVFGAGWLFFMAGEGDRHPKHIAYFLPEDEGVMESPFKKTYYFRNAHRSLLETISAPLAQRFVRVGPRFDPAAARFEAIPTLGVLSHELGHFVRRPVTDFAPLREHDRWITGVVQETAADVFGVLILAEVWAGPLGLDPADVIAYYLAECLRYGSRGLGHFPDSDGMFLQLSYLVQVGALSLEAGGTHDAGPVLAGEPEVVLAGLRSLARVLADTLLCGRAGPAVALHDAYGPPTPAPLSALVDALRTTPMPSVVYLQEQLGPDRVHAA